MFPFALGGHKPAETSIPGINLFRAFELAAFDLEAFDLNATVPERPVGIDIGFAEAKS